MTTLILSTKIMFFDKFSSYLRYISEEHNEEPWLLHILKLWSHQSKHDVCRNYLLWDCLVVDTCRTINFWFLLRNIGTKCKIKKHKIPFLSDSPFILEYWHLYLLITVHLWGFVGTFEVSVQAKAFKSILSR